MDLNRSQGISSPPPPLIEAFVPGSTELFRLVSYYLKIDLSAYVPALLLLGALSFAAKYTYVTVVDLIREHFVSSVEIRQDDELYNYVMAWVSKQHFSRQTPQSIAGIKTDSNLIYIEDDDDDDDELKQEDSVLADQDLDRSFDDYWMAITHKDKFKPIRYTPSAGVHFFKYKSRTLTFRRIKEEKSIVFWGSMSESIHISCFGRNPRVLKDLLEDAQKSYLDRDGDKTVIYRATRSGSGSDSEWQRCMSRASRPLSTVVLDAGQKQAVIDDVKDYLSPLTRRWYSNRGIPYRRGYLLYGPPGCGKSSLCFALAGLYHLKIYVVSLNSKALTEESLGSLFQTLPHRCIVLLEDIDAAGLTNKRVDNTPDEKSTEEKVKADVDGASGENKNDSTAKGISLSGLLNVIDGVASSEGRILIMTTNHLDRLDKALIRPGRVDMSIFFGLADAAAIRGLFRAVYAALEGDRSTLPSKSAKANGFVPQPNGATSKENPSANGLLSAHDRMFSHHRSEDEVASLAVRFADAVPPNEFSPAEIQGYLLRYKRDPDKAVEEAPAWVRTVQEERLKTGGLTPSNEVKSSAAAAAAAVENATTKSDVKVVKGDVKTDIKADDTNAAVNADDDVKTDVKPEETKMNGIKVDTMADDANAPVYADDDVKTDVKPEETKMNGIKVDTMADDANAPVYADDDVKTDVKPEETKMNGIKVDTKADDIIAKSPNDDTEANGVKLDDVTPNGIKADIDANTKSKLEAKSK